MEEKLYEPSNKKYYKINCRNHNSLRRGLLCKFNYDGFIQTVSNIKYASANDIYILKCVSNLLNIRLLQYIINSSIYKYPIIKKILSGPSVAAFSRDFTSLGHAITRRQLESWKRRRETCPSGSITTVLQNSPRSCRRVT